MSHKYPNKIKGMLLLRIIEISQSLEQEVHKAYKANLKMYQEKSRSLIFNLQNKNNPNLKLRLLLHSNDEEAELSQLSTK
jgi:hypothetical protein